MTKAETHVQYAGRETARNFALGMPGDSRSGLAGQPRNGGPAKTEAQVSQLADPTSPCRCCSQTPPKAIHDASCVLCIQQVLCQARQADWTTDHQTQGKKVRKKRKQAAMSSNSTPEAFHPRGLLVPGAKTGRSRPSLITRSVSEIPPSSPPSRLHAQQGRDEHKAGPAPFRHHDVINPVDLFPPMVRPGILSSRSSPGASRRASFLMATTPAAVDEAAVSLPPGAQSSRKGSDEKRRASERQHVEKTVTYVHPWTSLRLATIQAIQEVSTDPVSPF